MFVKLIFLFLISLSVFAEEECEVNGTPFQEVQNLLRAARDNCTEIPKGNFRIHDTLAQRAQHLLERDSNGNYRATFNIEFKPQQGVSATSQIMQTKMNECLQMVAPYLKGPDGNTITIRILSPDEIKTLPRRQRPRKYKIEIGPDGSRSNTRMFSADDDCATFTHEMLHHMGLQDEYHEADPEFASKWDCRPITREDSVMHTHTRGLEAALPRTIMCHCSSDACENLKLNPDSTIISRLSQVAGWPLTQEFQRANCTYTYSFLPPGTPAKNGLELVSDNGDTFVTKYQSQHPDVIQKKYLPTELVLTCICRDEACRRSKAQMLAKIGQTPPTISHCPAGTREESRTFANQSYSPAFHNGMLRFSTTPIRNTILYPNQFRRAVAGTCAENIAGYGMCSEYAYTGTEKGQCQTPEACRNPDYYIGTIPQK